jgi:hypothetical protein
MTSYVMSHDEAREALAALALDALDPAERDAARAHLVECPECPGELAALRDAAGELAYAVAPVPMSDDHRERGRSRLVARAGADKPPAAHAAPMLVAPFVDRPDHRHSNLAHGEAVDRAPARLTPAGLQIVVPPASPREVRSFWERSLRSPAAWVAVAASLVAAVSLYALYGAIRQRDALGDAWQMASSDKATRRSVVDSLRAVVEDRDKIIANLTGPQVAMVTLTSAGVKTPMARMFWNQPVNAWTFVAHNLPAPKPGRTYQLWLVTATQKISAGTFVPTPTGDAVVHATYVLPKEALAAVAVTDEPIAGSAQPTTVPFIVGQNSGR